MSKIKDITFHRFGRLVAIKRIGSLKGNSVWLCKCDCGKQHEALMNNLTRGQVRSCGCLRVDTSTKHGMNGSAEHRAWQHMIQRCTNPMDKYYFNYGGRGISVCERWFDFSSFYADMGNKPSPKYSLDRIDNNGSYCPENCRWADRLMQENNKRSNVFIEINGETKTAAQWSRHYGISYSCVINRLFNGIDPVRAVTTRLRTTKTITYMDQTHTIRDFAKLIYVEPHVVRNRLKRGWDVNKIASTPVEQRKKRKS